MSTEETAILISYPEIVDRVESAIMATLSAFIRDPNEAALIDARDEVLACLIADMLEDGGITNGVILRNGSIIESSQPTALYKSMKESYEDIVVELKQRCAAYLTSTIKSIAGIVYIRIVTTRSLVGCFLTTSKTYTL